MEDKNFEFLIEKYPKFYVDCKEMDYFIYKEKYKFAAISARIIVEEIVKYVDKEIEGDKFVDYHITRGKYFSDHYNNIYNKNECTAEIKDNIEYIWRNCSKAAHPDKRKIKREDVNLYAELTHNILKYFYSNLENKSVSSRYTPITGNEEWLTEMDIDSEKIDDLEKQMEEKEAEINRIQEEFEEKEQKHIEEKEQQEAKIKELEDSIKKFEEMGNMDTVIEGLKQAIKAEKEKQIENEKAWEEEVSHIKETYESTLEVLNNEIESLRNELKNYSSFSAESISKKSKLNKLEEIRYPPVEVIKKDKTEQHAIDPSQYEAIQSTSKKLVIDAGPGSGKTHVVIERIVHLINTVAADSLLVITFSEKAASELKERLKAKENLASEVIDKIHVSTIHSFCRTLLRDNSSDEINILGEDSREIFILDTFKEKFSGESYIPPSEYRAIFDVFDECSVFEVDVDAWIRGIKEHYFKDRVKKLDEEFIRFLETEGLGEEDFEFPEEYIRQNSSFNARWYAHKFLAVAEAYKEYQEILKKRSLYDYNRLQSATRDFLKENKDKLKTNYKNILIDEFQDTDVIQKEIFELLLENANSFTIVGDMDQSIYRWRGTRFEFFEEFANKEGFNTVILRNNYRSGKKIVEFNEKFIARDDEAKRLNPFTKTEGGVYCLDNEDDEQQAKRIVKTIKYLHDKKGVKYSDIGLLFRSTTLFKIKNFIKELEKENIEYMVKGSRDLATTEKYPEVKAMLYLLWYITEPMKYYTLSDFVFAINPVYEFEDKTISKLVSYSEKPQVISTMHRKELQSLGITGRDYEFLLALNDLKRRFNFDVEEDDRLTILGVYNKLLNITSIVDEQFKEKDLEGYNIKNNVKLLNLGLVSKIIKQYMDTVDKYDLDGAFKYLIENYGRYTSPYNDTDKKDGVFISTIYKAKGLEFPVVFICSLQKFSFPKSYFEKEWMKPKNLNSPFLEFPVFNKYLKYKSSKDEEEEFNEEERRVIYVGTTRAKDLLVVSGVKHPKFHSNSPELDEIKEMGIKELKLEYLDDLEIRPIPAYKSFKKQRLSYSSFNDYSDCKHKFDLSQNYGFGSDSSKEIELGIIIHDLLNKIHTKAKHDGKVSNDFIDEIIENVYENNAFLTEDKIFESKIEAVRDYWEEFGSHWKILDSELPVSIVTDEYIFNGKIDLIVQEDPNVNKVSIIDFKTTDDERLDIPGVRDKYKHQLELYYHALRNDPHYADYEIDKLKIFQITDKVLEDKEINNFKINPNDIISLIDTIDYMVKEMYSGIYDKNLASCYLCHLKDLCNTKKL